MVKLRMEFRSPNYVGTFVCHCHLLEYEDGGMMRLIRVEANSDSGPAVKTLSQRKLRLCGRPDLIGVSTRSSHR